MQYRRVAMGSVRSRRWAWRVTQLLAALGGAAALLCLAAPVVQAQTAHYVGQPGIVQASGTGNTFGNPIGLFVDSTETYAYVTDQANQRVVRVTINGGAETVVNQFNSSTNNNCSDPIGVVADSGGNVYFTCGSNTGIYKATLSGSTYTVTDWYTGVANGRGPRGMAIDSSNNIYIAVENNYQQGQSNQAYILKCNTSASCSTFYTFAVNTSSANIEPQALALDSSGNLYISDVGTAEAVYKLSGSTLTNIQTCTGQIVSGCYGLAVDASGVVYAGSNGPVVYRLTPNGSSYTSTNVYTQPALLYRAVAIALNPSGTVLYAADYTDNGGTVNGVANPSPGSTNLIRFGSSGQGFGSVPVGTTSSNTITLTFTFDSNNSTIGYPIFASTEGNFVGDFSVGSGGTCNYGQTYSAGTSCMVVVNFTPTRVGQRVGAVQLLNSSYQPFAVAYVYGNGTGPMVNYPSAVQKTLDTGVTGAEGLVGDGNGNIFIVGNNTFYEEGYAGGVYTRYSLATSAASTNFSSLQYLAMDGQGNLYLGDGGNNRIIKETYENGTYYPTVICNSGCGTNQLAVDTAGNVYFLSGATSAVEKLTLKNSVQANGTYYTAPASVQANNSNPWGIAVDPSGNIFYTQANATSGCSLYKLTSTGAGYVQTVLDSTLDEPTGIALDVQGNIYIAQDDPTSTTSGSIVKETYSSGTTYTKSTVVSSVNQPVGVWVDPSGNLFYTSRGNNSLYEIPYGTPPSLTFANTNELATTTSTTSGTNPVTLQNVGTATLNFAVPSTGTNPSVATNFTLGSATCPFLSTGSSVGTLSVNATCTYPITFAPTTGGSFSGSVVLTDNNLNTTNATQSIVVSGTGLFLTPTVTGISPSSGPIAGGSTVTISGTYLSGATGVSFGGTAATIVSDTNSSMTVTSPAATAVGSVDVTVTTPGGTSATSSADKFIYQATPTVTLTMSSGGSTVSSPGNIASGNVLKLTATVKVGTNPVNPGIVAFCSSTTSCTDINLLGTAPLNTAGTASVSFVPGIGSHSYRAIFLPTGDAFTATSSTSTLTVTAASTQPTTTTINAATGSAGNYSLSATVISTGIYPPAGPTGTVSFLDTTNSNANVGPGGLSSALGTPTVAYGFATATSFAVGSGPQREVLFDYNNDGKLDLAVCNTSANNVTVYTGNGNGTFNSTPVATFQANSSMDPNSITAGDFNGDGYQDLAITNFVGSAYIYLGNGSGTFTLKQTITEPTNSQSVWITAGDFNNDGILDLVMSNWTTNALTVYLGNGDGTFTLKSTISPGAQPLGTAVADFNGDGKLDFALTLQSTNAMQIYQGNGDGTFTLKSPSPTVGTGPYQVVSADFNGDSIPDLAVANSGGTTITILQGNGDFTFTAKPAVTVSSAPTYLAVGDFNGDSIVDLAADLNSGNVAILTGLGSGTFTTSTATSVALGQVLAGDLNGDGLPDIVGLTGSSTEDILLAVRTWTASASVSGVAVAGSGNHAIDASYAGDTNYAASTSSGTDTLVANALTTVTTLSTNVSAPQAYGTSITINAQVSPYSSQGHTVTGDYVTFKNGATTLCNNVALNSSGQASCTTTTLPISTTNSLTAVFEGDTNFVTSTSTALPFTITKQTATVVLNLTQTSGGGAATSVAAGTSVTLTATVTSNSAAVKPGIVNFCNAAAAHCTGANLLGSAVLTSAGTAAISLAPAAGSPSYTAVFLGNTTIFTATSASVPLTVTAVTPVATTTTVTSTGSASSYTLTATVTSGTVVSGGPTGTVSFLDTTNGNYPLNTTPATLGTATAGTTFVGTNTLATGIYPFGVVTGDFNGDGKLDIATVNEYSGNDTVSVFLSTGPGTFQSQATYQVGLNPYAIVVGDFNGDGILDLAVANYSGNNVSILMGSSSSPGTFQPAVNYSVGTSPYCIVTGDFNGDGILDLAVGNGNTVDILLGTGTGSANGTGVFGTATATPSLGSTFLVSSIAVLDYNGDGIQDLAVGNRYGTSTAVQLLQGVGTGAFTVGSALTAGSIPESVVAADFNADGKTDLAVANNGATTVTVFIANGSGGFNSSVYQSAASNATNLVAADFNGDGNLDLVVGSESTVSFSLLLGTSSGSFGNPTTVPAVNPQQGIAVGDLNNDGVPDLVVTLLSSTGAEVLLTQATSATATLSGVSVVGTGTHTVQGNYSGDSNDTASSGTVNLTAALKATSTALSLGTASPQLYGTAVTMTATVSPATAQNHSLTGDLVNFYNNVSTVLCSNVAVNSSGQASCTTSALTGGSNSLTAVFVGDTNFATSTSTATPFTINKATPTITWPTPAAITYGTQLTSAQLNATASVAGTNFVYSPAANTVLGAGQQTLSVTFTPSDTADYNTATASVSLTVNPAAQTITFAPPTSVTYGVAPITLTATGGASGNPVTFSVVSGPGTISGSTLTVTGAGSIVVAANQAASANYAAATQAIATIGVNPAAQTITFAPPTSVTYGVAPITLTATGGASGNPVTFSVVSGPGTISGSTLTVTGAGSIVVAANQAASANYAAATQVTATIGVTRATVTTLTLSSGGSVVSTVTTGSAVTLTASVMVNGSMLTLGTVRFCDATASSCSDIHQIGVAQLTSAGTATTTLVPSAGSHSYRAVYVATALNQTSASAAAPLSVTGGFATSTSISATGSVGNYTLTATVTGSGSQTAPVAGSVTFQDASNANFTLGSPATLGASTSSTGFLQSSTTASTYPYGIVTVDLNGDGKLDLVEANLNGSLVTALQGNGDGTFGSPSITSNVHNAAFVAVGDFNNDGKPDVAVTENSYDDVAILLGNGDGTFTRQSASPGTGYGPWTIVSGDFNRDGNMDLAVVNGSDTTVSILLGNGDGTFAAANTMSVGSSPTGIASGDFNGDGIADLAVTNFSNNNVTILLGNGDGTFTAASASPGTGSHPAAVTAADLNGDGKLDLAVANAGSNNVTILLGNGDGTFTAASASPGTGGNPRGVAFGDFNSDGKVDLAVTNSDSNNVSLLLGNGDGTFAAASNQNTGSDPQTAAVGDFNSDGTSDVAVANYGASTLTILLNEYTETATASITHVAVIGTGTHNAKASYGGSINYAPSVSAATGITAQPVATSLTLSTGTSSSTYGQSVTLTATLAPYTAAGVTSNGETVTFYSGSTSLGPGTLTNGVASLTTTALIAGPDSLTVVYAGDANLAASTSNANTVTVAKATPTITWPTPMAITYGTQLTSTQLNATASVAGTNFVYSPAANTVLNAGQQTLSVTFTPADTADYNTANATVTLTVNKATPTITWPTPTAITYGTQLTSTQLNATASVAGTNFVYSPAANTVLNAGQQTLSVTFTPTDTADYNTATATVTLTVNKATPTITWPTPSPIGAGSALSSTQLDATASVAGTNFVYSPAAGTVLDEGTDTLSVTFTPSDTADYTTATATVQLSVVQDVIYGGIQSQLAGPATQSGAWVGPVGVASDTSGNIYVGQFASASSIYKVNSATHAVSPYLSGTLSCPGQSVALSNVQMLLMDSNNNLYIADQGPGQIVVWSTTTNTCTAVYNAPVVFSLALDASGNIWYGAGSVVGKVAANAPSGTTGTPIISSGLQHANGLTFAPATLGPLHAGDLVVSDLGLGKVFSYSASSSFTQQNVLLSGLSAPFGVVFDGSDNLLLALAGNNDVVKYAAPGYTSAVPIVPYSSGAEGVALDPSGDIFITAYAGAGPQSAVTELCVTSSCLAPVVNVGSTSGTYSVNLQIASGTTVNSFAYMDQGVTGSSAEFHAPSSDNNPSLCTATTYATASVCDVDLMFTPGFPGARYGALVTLGTSGSILNTVYLGGEGAGPEAAFLQGLQSTVGAGLNQPQGVGVDSFGNVYIANTNGGNVIKVTAGGAQSTVPLTGLTSPTTLTHPGAVAVDGAGDLYIADYGNGRAVKIPWTGTAYGAAITLVSGLFYPNGIAVDGNGNVYIVDEGNYRVVKLPWTGAGYGALMTIGSGYALPTGVAVDGNLNVYVADYGGNAVYELPWTGSGYGARVTVGTGLSSPFAVTVDGNADVYIADSGNKRVVEVPWNGSAFGTQLVVASSTANGLASPTGVAVDASGNLYIADQTNNRIVKLADGTAPSVVFPTATAVGSTDTADGPLGFTLQNIGNAALSIAVPGSGLNPAVSSGFVYSGSSSTCPQLSTTSMAGSLAQGGVCTYAVNFQPTALSATSGTLVLTDNSLNVNGATQTVSLQGMGSTAVTQLAFGTAPATPVSLNGNAGSAVTVLEKSSGGATQTYATDTITLTVSGPNSYAATYTATAIAGVATFNLSSVSLSTAGNYSYTASLTGITSATATELVNKATPTITWPTPAAITYGTLLTSTQLNATASVAGTNFVYSPAANTVLNAGQQTLSVTFTPTDTVDYNTATATVPLTVNKATPVLDWFPLASIAYGTQLGSTQLDATASFGGSIVNGAYAYTPAANTVPPVGHDALSVVFTPNDATDFNTATGSNTITVAANPSTTSLAVNSGGHAVSTVAAGSVVTLTATVTSSGPPVTMGTVYFCNALATFCTNNDMLGTAQLTSTGIASMSLVSAAGTYSYQAYFIGNGTATASSSSTMPLTVTPSSTLYPTTTAIVATGNAGSYSLTATVVGTAAITAGPGLGVSFLDTTNSNFNLGTAALGASTQGSAFTSAAAVAASGATAIVRGDFNNDGYMDFAMLEGNNTVVVALGSSSGSFTLSTPTSLGLTAGSLASGDFNGDGKLDLALGTGSGNSIGVLLGNGDGTFTAAAPPSYSGTIAEVAVADFDGDGNLDVVGSDSNNNRVVVFLGNGNGTFNVSSPTAVGSYPLWVAVADFNGDDIPDVVVTNYNAGTASVLLGNGNGTFTAATPLNIGVQPARIAVGDFNGDGEADLVVSNYGAHTIVTYLGDGSGGFGSAHSTVTLPGNAPAIAVGDFNLDRQTDVVAAYSATNIITHVTTNSLVLLQGDGNGGLTQVATQTVGTDPDAIALGDFNGDGLPDLAVGTQNGTTNVLFTQLTQTAMATLANVSPAGAGIHNVDASYPGDSHYGASVSTTTGIAAQPVATTLSLTANPASSSYAQSVTLTATLNPSTAQGHAAGGIVTFYSDGNSIGTGTLSSGVATFALTTLPVGTHNLTASYAGDTNFVTSSGSLSSYTVSPAAKTISFPQPTTPVAVNSTATLSATSSNGDPVTYSVTSGSATISGSTVTYTTAGAVTIAADSAATSNFTAAATVSQTVTVTPADTAYAAPTTRVGVTSATQTATVNIATAGTLGTIYVVTQGVTGLDYNIVSGGTCTVGAAYSAGQACTVEYSFAPLYPGRRLGGVLLFSNASTPVLMGESLLHGTGTGPQALFSTPVATALASGFNGARGVSVDAAGNVYVAESQVDFFDKISPAGVVTQYPTSGLPTATAVDGAGNIFIASQNDIYEMPFGSTALSLYASGVVHSDNNMVVDSSGNLYITQNGNSGVYKFPAAAPHTPTVLFYGGTNVAGVATGRLIGSAIDANDNLYLLDFNHSRVLKVAAGSSTPTLAVSDPAIYYSQAIAVDAAGDLYVATANGLNRYAYANGSYGSGVSLASYTAAGVGAVMGQDGTLYLIEGTGSAVDKYVRTSTPSLTFPSTSDGSTSAPQSVLIENDGNAALVPMAVAASASFAVVAGSGSPPDCLLAGTVAAGANCNLSVAFAPTGTQNGMVTGIETLTDNNLNGLNVAQTVQLSGTAAALPTVTEVSPAGGTPAGGTPVTVTGTYLSGATAVSFGPNAATSFTLNSATSITAVSPPGVGTVDVQVTTPSGVSATSSADQFLYFGTQTISFTPASPLIFGVAPITLTASGGASGNPVTFTLVSGPGTLIGNTLTVTGAGSIVIAANQAGGSSYAAAPTVTATIVVNKATPAIVWATPSSVPYGTQLSAAQLDATSSTSGTFAYSPAVGTTPPVGTDTLSVTFAPADPADYTTATATVQLTVGRATPTDTLTATPASTTFAAAVTLTFTAPPVNGVAPTGVVSFYAGATLLGTGNVSANGIATLVTSALPLGSDTVTAQYPGDSIYAAASPSVTVQVGMVGFGSGDTLTSSNLTPLTTQPVTFTFTVPTVNGVAPTGTVNFYNATTLLGAGTLIQGVATLTSSALPAGQDVVNATYSGDATYAGGTLSLTEQVTQIGFTITSSSQFQTVNPGDAAVYNVTLTGAALPANSTLTLSATGLPPGATVTFSPLQRTSGTTATATMTVLTSLTQASLQRRGGASTLAYSLLLLPLLGIKRVRRTLRKLPRGLACALFAALLLAGISGVTGCGGSYFGPPPQTYTITITGTSGTLVSFTTVQLEVR